MLRLRPRPLLRLTPEGGDGGPASAPAPERNPDDTPRIPAEAPYTKADKARDYRLVAQALLTIGLAGTAATSLAPQAAPAQLWDWYLVTAISLIVSSRKGARWKLRAGLHATGLLTVLLLAAWAGPHGHGVRFAGLALLTVTAAVDGIRLMWTDRDVGQRPSPGR